MEIYTDIIETIKNDTLKGLSAKPKYIPSKYFYDDTGSKIFQEIMKMPEYYLTNCEYEIFNTYKGELFQYIKSGTLSFDIIELGAGDGYKTELLLNHFIAKDIHFKYLPVDISEKAVKELTLKLVNHIPELTVQGKVGDYFDMIDEIKLYDKNKKIILFLGSNIGNFDHAEAQLFLKNLAGRMNSGDQLLVGFDLKKDPDIILNAYNDKKGITARFNLNLLERLNRELGANFNMEQFMHAPHYDADKGMAISHIISKKDQDVYFKEFDSFVHFNEWEAIQTEISQKYTRKLIIQLAESAGLVPVHFFFDSKKYFTDVLFNVR